MNLVAAIQPTLPARIAIVGGGGKTTALFQIARQLPGTVWVTTTTHLGLDQLDEMDQHFIVSGTEEIDLRCFLAKRTTLITGMFTADARVKGLDPEVMQELVTLADENGVSLVVEADGARSHPVKAPAEHEPVIPAWARTVVVVLGLSALGKPFNGEWVHRPERFTALTGAQPGEPLSIEMLMRLLAHPLGGLKGIPAGAQKVALLNQADTAEVSDLAAGQAETLLSAGYDRVLVGSLLNAPDSLEVFIKP